MHSEVLMIPGWMMKRGRGGGWGGHRRGHRCGRAGCCSPQGLPTQQPLNDHNIIFWFHNLRFHLVQWAQGERMACCQSHNLISKMIARNTSGHCSGVADELVHCCTMSLCYLGAEMIITETQISIQRSYSWATNYCKCLHWVYLHHCWNIVNVFRARMCSWYSPKGVYGEILSLGTVLIRTLPGAGSVLDNMISVDHVIQYHPCCQWIPRNTSLQCDEYWQC